MSFLEQPQRNDWHAQASCSGEMRSLFYAPTAGERKAQRLSRERRAKALCGLCPVSDACLSQAIANDERFGIWGGMTTRERRIAAIGHEWVAEAS